eukprot:scaffold8530_cov121-Isochrysis_galbana.AAC.1
MAKILGIDTPSMPALNRWLDGVRRVPKRVPLEAPADPKAKNGNLRYIYEMVPVARLLRLKLNTPPPRHEVKVPFPASLCLPCLIATCLGSVLVFVLRELDPPLPPRKGGYRVGAQTTTTTCKAIMTDPPIADRPHTSPGARRSRHARRQTTSTCPRPHRRPASRQGTLRHPRTVVDRPGPKPRPRRGCGCEFLQGWLPCWLLALHHVWHAIRSRTRQPHRRSSTRLFALSAAGAFSGGIWPIRHRS